MRVHHPMALLFLTLVFVSCSSAPKKEQAPQDVQYSSETQKSFEEIEREMLLERYKRLRVEDGILQQRPGQAYNPEPRGLPPRSNEGPLKRDTGPQKAAKPKQLQPQPAAKASSTKKRARVEVNPEEQRREIQQNLTFYCMKMRKDSRFATGESCEDYTHSVERKCLEKFSEGERALTRCVKSQL